MDNSVVLSVGDSFHLRRGKDRITYAGMPSEDVFSIVQRKREALPYGWSRQAWNGLHPYDWTGRVRRVWRGNPLFS